MRSLTDLRSEIDAIDAELLRLIDARAGLAEDIAAAKVRDGSDPAGASLLRPDREAMLLRKLLAMPRGHASDGVVVRIWRELISESLRIQSGGLHLNLSGRDPSREVLLWARERFGFAPSYSHLDDPNAVIAACRDPRQLGVLSLDPRNGAWWARLLAEPKVRILAALPETAGHFHAVAIGSVTPEPTGDDITFFVSDAQGTENRLIDDLAQRGFAAEWLCSAQGLKLFALSGFVQEHDPRLSGALGSLSGVIGAAPRI